MEKEFFLDGYHGSWVMMVIGVHSECDVTKSTIIRDIAWYWYLVLFEARVESTTLRVRVCACP